MATVPLGKKIFLTLAFLLLFPIRLIFAESATLEWDASTDNVGVTGYKIYYGVLTGDYTSNIDVGDVLIYTITNLQVGQTYFFVATAYDAAGNESGYSDEVNQITVDITSPSTIILRITTQ